MCVRLLNGTPYCPFKILLSSSFHDNKMWPHSELTVSGILEFGQVVEPVVGSLRVQSLHDVRVGVAHGRRRSVSIA